MRAALVGNYLRLNVDGKSWCAYRCPSDLAVFSAILLHVPGTVKSNYYTCFNASAHNNLLFFTQYWAKVSITEISLSPLTSFILEDWCKEAIAWTGTWPKTFFTPTEKINRQDSTLFTTMSVWRHLSSQLSLFALLEIKITSHYNWMRQSLAESLCTWRSHWLHISHTRSNTYKTHFRLFHLFRYKK